MAGLLLSSPAALARKLDFKDAKVGVYLGGTIGTSNIQKTPFSGAMPTTVSYPDYNGANYGYSGLLGVNFSMQNTMSVKLGVEILYGSKALDVEGKNEAGTVLLSETSEVLGINPEVMVEVHLKRGDKARLSVGVGGGYLTSTIKNQVAMTAAGVTALGVNSYIEEGGGNTFSGKAFGNFEFIFVDNVSFVIQAGYRYAKVYEYKHTRNATTPIGTVASGDQMRNADGSARQVDFSGAYGGAQLIFWMW